MHARRIQKKMDALTGVTTKRKNKLVDVNRQNTKRQIVSNININRKNVLLEDSSDSEVEFDSS